MTVYHLIVILHTQRYSIVKDYTQSVEREREREYIKAEIITWPVEIPGFKPLRKYIKCKWFYSIKKHSSYSLPVSKFSFE